MFLRKTPNLLTKGLLSPDIHILVKGILHLSPECRK
jgi:hypothetical protein